MREDDRRSLGPRAAAACALLALAGGCGPSGRQDSGAGADLAPPPPDLVPPDGGSDFAMPDLAMPDLAMPDLTMPDLAMPDLAMPDFTVLDLTQPDLATPDLAMPDLLPPSDLAIVRYAIAGLTPRAWDISDDGSAVVVGLDGNELRVQCFNADGTTQKAAFVAATYDSARFNSVSLAVARAGVTHESVFTWHMFNIGWPNPYDWQNHIVFLDANCDVRSGPQPLDVASPGGILRPAQVKLSDQGRVAVLYEDQSANAKRLLLFQPNGLLDRAQSIGQGACQTGALTHSLAMSPSTGTMVIGCEAIFDRYYRRYRSNGDPIENQWMPVPQANTGMWHDFQVGMNDAGQFVFLARLPAMNTWQATFYSDIGNTVAMPLFGTGGGSANDVITTSGGDFIFAVSGNGFTRARFDPLGNLVSTSPSGSAIRLDANDAVYVLSGNEITRNPFPL